MIDQEKGVCQGSGARATAPAAAALSGMASSMAVDLAHTRPPEEQEDGGRMEESWSEVVTSGGRGFKGRKGETQTGGYARSAGNLDTAGSHYCCTAQDSLNSDQLTAHFEVHLEKHA